MEVFYKTFSGHFKYQELKEKVNFLNSIWIFKKTNKNQIERILLCSKPTRFSKNTVLFKPGQSPSHIFVIISGEVTLFHREAQSVVKYQPFSVLGSAQVFGQEEVIRDSSYSYGATCSAAETVILRVGKGLFQEVFDSYIS